MEESKVIQLNNSSRASKAKLTDFPSAANKSKKIVHFAEEVKQAEVIVEDEDLTDSEDEMAELDPFKN